MNTRAPLPPVHNGFPTELGTCVPRDYLLTIGVRR